MDPQEEDNNRQRMRTIIKRHQKQEQFLNFYKKHILEALEKVL
jgi:hypothetical protein